LLLPRFLNFPAVFSTLEKERKKDEQTFSLFPELYEYSVASIREAFCREMPSDLTMSSRMEL
jgi:hypothetical protein